MYPKFYKETEITTQYFNKNVEFPTAFPLAAR